MMYRVEHDEFHLLHVGLAVLRLIVIDSSVASYFQCYIHIRPLAVYIIGIKDFFTSAFKNMAFATYLAIMQTSPFVQDIIQTFFSCG